ncbi:MAG: tripartite tricarboxylate transporter TctB family protein [Proteobacteria bacterium]|nr:tripartite tricarboxylate transporter TctB family protein [Pseudomonadota bacterium]
MIGNINREKLGAFLFLAFSLAYGYATLQIPMMEFSEDEPFTSRTMPYALALLGIAFSLLKLLIPDANREQQRLRLSLAGFAWKPTFALVVAMLVYGLIFGQLGFLIATVLFLMAGLWILGERRKWVIFASSVPVTAVFWLILTQLLDIYLSPGAIFESVSQ